MTEPNTAQIEAELKLLIQKLYDTLSQRDFSPWMETLHEPPGEWLLGTEVVNIREASEGFGAAWDPEGDTPIDRQEIDDLEIKVRVLGPSVAYALCTSPDRRWYFKNGQEDRASTAETWVFVLTEKGWKLHSGQSAIFPIEG